MKRLELGHIHLRFMKMVAYYISFHFSDINDMFVKFPEAPIDQIKHPFWEGNQRFRGDNVTLFFFSLDKGIFGTNFNDLALRYVVLSLIFNKEWKL